MSTNLSKTVHALPTGAMAGCRDVCSELCVRKGIQSGARMDQG